MSKDQVKSPAADSNRKAEPSAGKLVGNRDLQGKGLQSPLVGASYKDATNKKNGAKDGKSI
jgi:hypothetical protein